MKRFVPIFIISIGLLISCTTDNSTNAIPDVTFDEIPSQEFDITDFVKEIKLIPIATDTGYLLPYSRYFLGNKFLIAVTRKEIFQFTSDGKFVRVLARAGGGPTEFQNVNSFTMDPAEEKLYVDHDGNRDGIAVFDLINGGFSGVIPKPLSELGTEGFGIESMLFENKTLYVAPEFFYKGTTSLYLQGLSGELIKAFPRDDQTVERQGAHVFNSIYLTKISESISYMSRDKDTLFSITDQIRKPVLAIHYSGKFKDNQELAENKGFLVSISNQGPSTFIFLKTTAETKHSPDGGSSAGSGMENQFYLVRKEDYKPIQISGLHWGSIEIPIKRFFSQRPHDDKFILVFSAIGLKQMIEKALDEGVKDPEELARLKEWDEKITENDNPILIIGKMK